MLGWLRLASGIIPAICPIVLAQPNIPSPPQTSGTDPEAARTAFELGVIRFDAGQYGEALEAFEVSFRLQPVPVVLFNIGVCMELLGDRQGALDVLWRYLRDFSTTAPPEEVAEVRARVAALEGLRGAGAGAGAARPNDRAEDDIPAEYGPGSRSPAPSPQGGAVPTGASGGVEDDVPIEYGLGVQSPVLATPPTTGPAPTAGPDEPTPPAGAGPVATTQTGPVATHGLPAPGPDVDAQQPTADLHPEMIPLILDDDSPPPPGHTKLRFEGTVGVAIRHRTAADPDIAGSNASEVPVCVVPCRILVQDGRWDFLAGDDAVFEVVANGGSQTWIIEDHTGRVAGGLALTIIGLASLMGGVVVLAADRGDDPVDMQSVVGYSFIAVGGVLSLIGIPLLCSDDYAAVPPEPVATPAVRHEPRTIDGPMHMPPDAFAGSSGPMLLAWPAIMPAADGGTAWGLGLSVVF
jgi:hypothetical protein